MAKTKAKPQSNTLAGVLVGPFRAIAEQLPLSKLTAAQSVNCVMDIIGGLLCLAFILRSDNDLYRMICFLSVLVLSVICIFGTDRRRRF